MWTEYMDWIVGFTTLISVELMIRRKWYAWVTAILNQFVWLTYIYYEDQWGLLPLNIALFIMNTRGLLAWLRTEDFNNGQEDHVPNKTDSPGCQASQTRECESCGTRHQLRGGRGGD